MQRLYAALFLSMLSGSLRLPMSQGSMGVSGNISPSESGQAKDTVTGLCLPWPECATAWVDKALRERETVGGSLTQLMQAIDKGKSQNCSQTSMCKPEKRIEEIDKMLAGVQKLWEEQDRPSRSSCAQRPAHVPACKRSRAPCRTLFAPMLACEDGSTHV